MIEIDVGGKYATKGGAGGDLEPNIIVQSKVPGERLVHILQNIN